jgi:hypothetical protein
MTARATSVTTRASLVTNVHGTHDDQSDSGHRQSVSRDDTYMAPMTTEVTLAMTEETLATARATLGTAKASFPYAQTASRCPSATACSIWCSFSFANWSR